LSALVLASGSRAVACTGDCDGNGAVGVNECVRGVAIALGQSSLDACPSFDRNGSRTVTVDELLMGVNAVLRGCPGTPTVGVTPTRTASATASATITPTASPSTTPTATPTVNQPPIVSTGPVYRTFEGFDVRVPLASDPEGGPVQCMSDGLPPGATLEDEVLSWTPNATQLGPFSVPFSCVDAAVPPESAAGTMAFKVLPLDPCSRPECEPATGCSVALPAPDELCCTETEITRVAEPQAECPAGRVAFIGRNLSGFGRLQNCDTMQVRNFAQSGAQMTLHVEARCLNTNTYIEVFARIETRRRVLVNTVKPQVFFTPDPETGFARARSLTFTVQGGGPFFDIEEDGEANVLVRLTDIDGVTATANLRVRLRFARPPDLPELD
jgi:hypothetical protein